MVERPAGVMALAVNNIHPTAGNIVSGKYPLSLRYQIVTGEKSGPTAAGLIRKLQSPEYALFLREAGLIPMFEPGEKNEKEP